MAGKTISNFLRVPILIGILLSAERSIADWPSTRLPNSCSESALNDGLAKIRDLKEQSDLLLLSSLPIKINWRCMEFATLQSSYEARIAKPFNRVNNTLISVFARP
jgi:hypothetical protein